MANFVEMIFDSIRVHVPTSQHVVILREKEAERYLPIWIGLNEANAIALRVTGIMPERPITHDLLANILDATNVKVESVMVTSLTNEVFYAQIVASNNGNTMEIDARPSDAIAIAVRVGAKILVSEDVLEKAGVLPSPDKDSGEENTAQNQENLSIFREMVNSMELPDLGEQPPQIPES